MVNHTTSGSAECMKLIRILVLDDLQFSRHTSVKFVLLKDNLFTDALSRLNFKDFWSKAPKTTRSLPDLVPGVLLPPEKFFIN